MCGIVEEGSRHKKQRGRGEGGLSWLQVGSKSEHETVQGLGCHYFLGEAVPFEYGLALGEEYNIHCKYKFNKHYYLYAVYSHKLPLQILKCIFLNH